MRVSTKLALILACFVLVVNLGLAVMMWTYDPEPNTAGEVLRPILIFLILVVGLFQAYHMMNLASPAPQKPRQK